MLKNTNFTGQPIFSQLLNLIPSRIISKNIAKHSSDRYYKRFKSYDHLVAMLYACFEKCTSIREVTTGMMACHFKLLHLGLKYLPKRSTLSEANSKRSEQFFSDLYHDLYRHYFGVLPDSPMKGSIENRLFLIDSTTISLFTEVMKGMGTRAVDGRKKGGAKAHMLVKANQDVPCFTMITHATKNDKEILAQIKLPKGAIVVFDKGYNSYKQFLEWDKQGITWITRMIDVAWQEQLESKQLDESEKLEGVIADQKIQLGRPSNNPTPKIIVRKITFYDKVTGRSFYFITNNTTLKASMIAALYKRRWQIELLFKRLKQNYPLRNFLGESENAIKIQIWCSLITDLLLKIVSKMTNKKWSFANLSAMIRLHLMNYISIIRFLNNPEKSLIDYKEKLPDHQLRLFT
jgi:Transposase DDE domain/Domain of unknown function (DUF4372)